MARDPFRKKIERREQAFQISVVEMLGMVLTRATWFCHVPNGGYRTEAEAGILLQMGVKPGVYDLMFVHRPAEGVPPIVFFIELKADDGESSVAQKLFGEVTMPYLGIRTYVARTWADVWRVLQAENIPTRIKGGTGAVPDLKPAPQVEVASSGRQKRQYRTYDPTTGRKSGVGY